MPMHIEIDRETCNGYGNCIIAAPDVFDLEPDTNVAFVKEGHPVEAERDVILEAIADCPVNALRLVES